MITCKNKRLWQTPPKLGHSVLQTGALGFHGFACNKKKLSLFSLISTLGVAEALQELSIEYSQVPTHKLAQPSRQKHTVYNSKHKDNTQDSIYRILAFHLNPTYLLRKPRKTIKGQALARFLSITLPIFTSLIFSLSVARSKLS